MISLKSSALSQIYLKIVLSTVDVVGLFPNIPHEEGLSALRKRLDESDKKEVSADTLVQLAELVLKNKCLQL